MKKPAALSTADLDTAAIPYRRMVREVLNASKRKLSEAALVALMKQQDPGLSPAVAKAALEWNLKRGHVNFEHNAELEVDEWTLTTRGKQSL